MRCTCGDRLSELVEIRDVRLDVDRDEHVESMDQSDVGVCLACCGRSMTKHAFATVLVLAGCQAVGDPDPSTLAERVAAARDRMHERLTAAKAIQVAIALGDLERARAEAHRITTQDEPDFLPEWQPYLDDIRRAAAQIEVSADSETAAKTMAQLGRECARCHEAAHAQITFAREPEPTNTPKLGAQMASHQWAAARMWEGIIGSSTDRWLAGARTLPVRG